MCVIALLHVLETLLHQVRGSDRDRISNTVFTFSSISLKNWVHSNVHIRRRGIQVSPAHAKVAECTCFKLYFSNCASLGWLVLVLDLLTVTFKTSYNHKRAFHLPSEVLEL